MIPKFLFLFCATLVFISSAQDSLVFEQNLDKDSVFKESRMSQKPIVFLTDSIFSSYYLIDCAHGHICCQAGCHCCAELGRPNEYEIVNKTNVNGVKRTTTVEKYQLALDHAPGKIIYSFSKKNEENPTIYYSARRIIQTGYNEQEDFQLLKKIAISEFEDGKALVYDEQGVFHVINGEGQKIPFEFASSEKLSEEYFKVSILSDHGRIFGIADAKGNIQGDLAYQNIQEESEGLYLAQRYNPKTLTNFLWRKGSFRYIDITGKEVIKAPMTHADPFINGSAKVCMEKNGWLLIDKKGEILTEESYDYIGEYAEGFYAVRRNEKLGFINAKGIEVIKPKYEWVYKFSNGMAAFLEDGKWGFINQKGEEVIPAQYNRIRNFNNERAVVAIGADSNRDKWGIINKKGEYVLKPTYDELSIFNSEFSVAFINGQGYGLVNTEGKEIMSCHYRYDLHYQANVKNSIGYIMYQKIGESHFTIENRKGKKTELTNYDYANFLYDESNNIILPLIRVRSKNNKYGIINLDGEIIVPCKYQSISARSNQLLYVYKDDKQGCISYDGEEVIPIIYQSISEFISGLAQVTLNEEVFYINIKGERVDQIY